MRGRRRFSFRSPFSFEALETRRELAADLKNGMLNVSGTEAADTIEVTLKGSDLLVRIGKQTSQFSAARVKQISVRGLGGDDVITLGANLRFVHEVDGGA